MAHEDKRDSSTLDTGPSSASGTRSSWRRLLSPTPADLQRRRERHRRRPMPLRIASAVGGVILGVVGLLVLLPIPEVGLALLLVALGLLALEFDWAARLLGRVVAWASSTRAWFRQLSRPVKWLVTGAGIVLVVLIVWAIAQR